MVVFIPTHIPMRLRNYFRRLIDQLIDDGGLCDLENERIEADIHLPYDLLFSVPLSMSPAVMNFLYSRVFHIKSNQKHRMHANNCFAGKTESTKKRRVG